MNAAGGRRLAAIAAMGLFVVVAAHSTLWWWVTGQIEQQVVANLAAPAVPGWRARAGVAQRGGWPLAATVAVPDLVAQAPLGPDEAMRWRAARLVVALELMRPRTLVVALEGAQEVQLGAAPPIPLNAEVMRVLLPLELGVSARAVKVEIAGLRAGPPEVPLTVGRLDIAVESRPAAQQGEPALTLVATAGQVTLPPVRDWPLGAGIARLLLDLVVTGPVPRSPDLAERAEAWRDGGGALELRRLELDWGEVSLSGGATLALDAQLQPMGAATARLRGHTAALRALTSSGVLTPRGAMAAGAVLGLMARPPAQGEAPVVEVPLSLQNRTLSLGRIPLVRLPELVWRRPG